MTFSELQDTVSAIAAAMIQSISKVLKLALGPVGDQLWSRVGREPSRSPFNAIVQLERGILRNPVAAAGLVDLRGVSNTAIGPAQRPAAK